MPEKRTIYHKDGKSVEMDAIDARDAVRRHPAEWSNQPFGKADEKPKDPDGKPADDKAPGQGKKADDKS